MLNELLNCANGAWLWFYQVAPIYPVLATAVVAAGTVAVVAWYEHRKEFSEMRKLLIALCACAAILPSIAPASARSLEKDAWGCDPNARCLQRDNPSFYKSLRDAADDIRDKELPVCDADDVQETLKRVTHLTTVVETKNIKSDNLTESRFCKAEIVAANGSMIEVVYELRWTSQTEGRFWLQIKGARYL